MNPTVDAAALLPDRLRINALDTPVGIDTPRPRFSWRFSSPPAETSQIGYRIQVSGSDSFAAGLMWDSGTVESTVPYDIEYAGEQLHSLRTYWWRVQLTDTAGTTAPWSPPSVFETGVLDPSMWFARWVGAAADRVGGEGAVYLRGSLVLPNAVRRARAVVTALGWYRLFVNGVDHTGATLVPRYTPLGQTVEYQVYDVTDALQAGENVIAMAVGDGRYRGHLGYFDRRGVYGDRLAGFAQLHLDLADGSTMRWGTDTEWQAGAGRITSSDPKFGERADLRIPEDDWLTAAVAPARFGSAVELPHHQRRLVGEEVARVGTIATITPNVKRTPNGRQLVDLGQNVAGVLRIRLRGAPGTIVRMTFGEAVTPDGEFDPDWIIQNPKKPWAQRDEVVLDGSEHWWQPWFTIHGFRYVDIEGLDHDLSVTDVEGVALSTMVDVAGSFAASDPRLTRLWQNVLWSTRSNFTDTATDCPTRERSGWTGDLQVFAPTATGIVDSQAFLRRYLRNVAAEQSPDGNVAPWSPSERSGSPGFIARVVDRVLGNSVGWGDVTVLAPSALHRYYGDVAVLEHQFQSMSRWVDRLARNAHRRGIARWFVRRSGEHERFILDSGFHWGEWLRPGESFPANITDGFLHGAPLATAYFAHSARTLADAATVLGRAADADRYREIADRARTAWRTAFLRDAGGRIGRDLQDDYVRAIAFGLLEGDEIDNASQRLVELITRAGEHLGTGFLSTPMLLSALTDTGHADLAYRLLLQNTAPSWLRQVELGATTIWETWEGYDEDGRARESHNHYALGAVAGWMRERLLGIEPLAPGYRRVRIAPVINDSLSWAEGMVSTPYGDITVRWDNEQAGGTIGMQLPPGVDAEVDLPNGDHHANLGGGTHTFSW